MQSILTQCPRCQTSFKVSEKQLAIAEGMVRCGSCLDVFSALANRITLKQPVSLNPAVDPEDEDFTEENASYGQKPSAYDSSIDALQQNPTDQSAAVDNTANYPSDYSETPDYGTNQPGNFSTSSSANTSHISSEEMEFVLDDERGEVSLGDMMLDDMELDDQQPFTHDDEDQDEPDSTGEYEAVEDTSYQTVYEEYTEADEQYSIDDNIFEEPPAISLEPQRTSSRSDNSASYEDALGVEDDPGSSFDQEFFEADGSALSEPVAEFSAEQVFAAEFAEPVIEDTNSSYVASNENYAPYEQNFIAQTTPDFQQYPLGDSDLHTSPTILETVNNPEPAEFILDTDEDVFSASPTITHETVASKDIVNPPAQPELKTEESPFDFDANLAEELEQTTDDVFFAPDDDDENIAARDSFNVDNFTDLDGLHEPGFSALTLDETLDAELAAPAPKVDTKRDKEEMRQYLAELEDADALEPLPATMMDTIEVDPLTLEVSHTLRKYVTTFAWACLGLAFLAAFVLQVVASNLELMQKSPLYSRYLPIFCRVLDCPEPDIATAGIESLQAQDLVVRSHPQVADALEVSFIFRNNAEIPQAFPLIELSFRDSNKVLIANRLFKPEEYLPPELAALDTMPARSSVQVMMELTDPSSDAVDYAITFREASGEVLENPATLP
ncbi:MAG: DUF3426 domain-containing protein [Pseudomonadota bacterium]